MNIWYIHPYAGSPKYGMSFRPYYLAKYFNKFGHNTVIISSSYHHLCTMPYSEKQYLDIEGVSFYLQKTTKYQGNGLRRILSMLGFGLGLFGRKFNIFSKKNNPDIIIASTAHPFHLFAAKYYAQKRKAKLVLEVRDIWPLSLQELVGISKFHPLNILIDIFQKFGYKKCDHCVSLLENSEPLLIKEGLKKNHFTYIPNGVEIESNKFFENFPPMVNKIEKKLSKFETVIGYTGAFGIPNNLLPLIEAAQYLQEYSIGILLVGDGEQKEFLKKRVKDLKLNNVMFVAKVPKACVELIIKNCDAMFINALKKRLYQYGISPNKIFDYMIQNKPVFNGINSPGNPLEKAKSEIRFNSNDPLDIAKKIIDFHHNKNDLLIDSSSFVEKNYTYFELSRKYINLMENLVRS